jgi:hypothetical protein
MRPDRNPISQTQSLKQQHRLHRPATPDPCTMDNRLAAQPLALPEASVHSEAT